MPMPLDLAGEGLALQGRHGDLRLLAHAHQRDVGLADLGVDAHQVERLADHEQRPLRRATRRRRRARARAAPRRRAARRSGRGSCSAAPTPRLRRPPAGSARVASSAARARASSVSAFWTSLVLAQSPLSCRRLTRSSVRSAAATAVCASRTLEAAASSLAWALRTASCGGALVEHRQQLAGLHLVAGAHVDGDQPALHGRGISTRRRTSSLPAASMRCTMSRLATGWTRYSSVVGAGRRKTGGTGHQRRAPRRSAGTW